MAVRRLWSSGIMLALCLLVVAPAGTAQAPASQLGVAPAPSTTLTIEEQETFLKNAKIIRERESKKGITGTIQATLSDGRITHDASIQSIDEYQTEFKSNRGVEFNFRDTWRYNVAAYRLDRLLSLGMIPVHVERRHRGKPSSFGWWVDDVLMDEGERLKKKMPAPSSAQWNEQMWHVRMFDQLIYNVDRNLGNLLIDKNWTIWMIDHSRSFRLMDQLKGPENLAKIDRQVFERLKALDAATLKQSMADYLTGPEQKALLLRRDRIVEWFEKAGPSALIDRKPAGIPSGQLQ